jgi:hypothetical protein
MTVEHSGLTGSQVHWPRGTDTATNGQIFVADGAGAGSFQNLLTLVASEIPITKVRTTGSTKNNDATLANDDTLANYALAASTTYKVEGTLLFDSANGTTGAQFKLDLVSGTLSSSGIQYISSKTGDESLDTSGNILITDTATVASPGGSTTVEVRITGFVTTSTASVFNFQFAQNMAAATDTILRQGSHLGFTKVS